VLLAQGNRELAHAIEDRLGLTGIEVESVTTAELALERALARPPSAICLATELSGALDGWQLLVRLKANPATAHVPVVVCSDAQGRTTAATLGAASFVLTPFTAEQVSGALAELLWAERTSILVVAGDQALRRLIVETLARDGGKLLEAADGLEALGVIGASRPDALVLDLALPGPDGFGDIEQVLERPETRGLPVVVLAGRELSAGERRFLRARNASLVAKSKYSGDQLRRLIHHPRFASSTLAILGIEDIPTEAMPSSSLVHASNDASPAGRTSTQPFPIDPIERPHAS
jgi:CheY-like chemotaxis protein